MKTVWRLRITNILINEKKVTTIKAGSSAEALKESERVITQILGWDLSDVEYEYTKLGRMH